MKTAVYPGSFDPVTFGHIDIIKRSSKLFDKVIVCVLNNPKKMPSFTNEERISFINRVTCDISNIEIVAYDGLLIDFLQIANADIIIKGLRAVSDFEYEFQMALANNKLSPKTETLFLATNIEYSYLSSSIVREIANYGGDLSQFVPKELIDDIYLKLKK